MDLSKSVPQVLLEDNDYKVFLDIVNQISKDIHDIISEFPNLVDIDNAPEIFLPKLAALVNYSLRTDMDTAYQREIIQRLFEIYKSRGSNDEIIMAATYGDYNNWAGAHIFYPHSDTDRTLAQVLYPIDEVFKHSKSKFSGSDKYPGSYSHREGTITLRSGYFNEDIRSAIKRVVPAGIRIYYEFILGSDSRNGFIVDYGNWTIDYDTALIIDLKDQNFILKPAKRSHPTGSRSGTGVFSGTRAYTTKFFVNFLGIEPSHSDYQAYLVQDKYVGDSLDYEILDLEISIYKDE